MNNSHWTLILLLGVLVTSGGCSELRKLTYPTDFVYLEKSKVQSTMQELADGIGEISNQMSSGNQSSRQTADAILVQLSKMESVALGLQARRSASQDAPLVTSHCLLYTSDAADE